jgi:uncharacterized protein YjiK
MNSAVKLAIACTVVALVSVIFWNKIYSALNGRNNALALSGMGGGQKNTSIEVSATENSGNVNIADKWDLPEILNEISGIAYMSDQRIAAVQDELGKIFIYNTQQHKIEKEILFGPSGDYEGIALVGTTAYILRSDGTLFEVHEFNSAKNPEVKQHNTHLTAEHDVEGLCYDAKGKRLLLAIKSSETHTKDYKGIYAFDLASKKLASDPVYKIDLTNKAFGKNKKKKSGTNPSGIAIHPTTQDIYITSASGPKLLVLDYNSGNIKYVYELDDSEFQQPEGITFSNKGELFISNEGGKGAGNILKIIIK